MTDYADDEISLLDVAVFLAEHWLLLVIGPVVAALIAYAMAATTEQTYTSSIDIEMPYALAREGQIADPQAIYREAFVPRDAVSMTDIKDGVRITATGATAGEVSGRVLEARRQFVAPAIEALSETRVSAQRAIDILAPLVEPVSSSIDGEPEAALVYVQLRDALVSARRHLLDVDRAIAALATEQPPSVRREGRTSALDAALAGIGAFIILLAAVAIRRGIAVAARDERNSERFDRIRAALLFRRGR
ncbi:hypothetical protein [Pelagibacterium limicola]|uniref:hypothetical protein n=1 Tax=Pelagibacterium limicola TaxID=2791022 RepID=UPI0018AF7AA0|nr:hypothetical protein [Pelagibacterium limicola]